MNIPTIQKTRDYSIFKSVSFNREKNKRHIEQIKEMILKENLLHLHPILINEKMEVVDGQHRLEAAKDLNLDVFYIQDKISYEHILNSNLFQKKLNLSDVIKFYAYKDGLSSYLWLDKWTRNLNISPKALIGLIMGVVSSTLIQFIKSGKFDLPSNDLIMNKLIDSLKKFLAYVKDKRITPYSMFSSSYFTIAFRNLMMMRGFNEDVWYGKLDQRWFDLKPQLNAKEWTRLLVGIYNWKNQNPLSPSNE